MLWVNATAQSKSLHGVWGILLFAIEAVGHDRIGCAVAAVTVNGIAAADFQHSSLFAVAGRALGVRAAGARRQSLERIRPCCQAHWKKVHVWGSVNAAADVMGPPLRCSHSDPFITFRCAAPSCCG